MWRMEMLSNKEHNEWNVLFPSVYAPLLVNNNINDKIRVVSFSNHENTIRDLCSEIERQLNPLTQQIICSIAFFVEQWWCIESKM